METETLKTFADLGANAVIALALLRGLLVAEKVVNRLLDTLDKVCGNCEGEITRKTD